MRMKKVTERQTLQDAAKEFLSYKRAQKISERTMRDYHKYLSPFIAQSSNSMNVNVLKAEILDYFEISRQPVPPGTIIPTNAFMRYLLGAQSKTISPTTPSIS